jgi:pimeloyl-ACP methyl ester carboxylesterase
MASRPAPAGRLPLNARVPSSDGVDVVVHELGGDASLPPLLISHATGFHGRAYQEIADALAARSHCFAFDHRGHGHTEASPAWRRGEGVDWAAYGDDCAAVAEWLAPDGGLVGFGHSMGASTLLMTAARHPHRFSRLVLFEPIVGIFDAGPDPEQIPLVVAARRRRRRFASYDEAYDNFAGKFPLALMTPGSLRHYVEHGLRPTSAGDVELCCPPELEAATFVASRRNGVWALLPQVDVPTLVVTGVIERDQPSAWAPVVAGRLPEGELLMLPHQTHFGPFSHPAEVAALVSDNAGDV